MNSLIRKRSNTVVCSTENKLRVTSVLNNLLMTIKVIVQDVMIETEGSMISPLVKQKNHLLSLTPQKPPLLHFSPSTTGDLYALKMKAKHSPTPSLFQPPQKPNSAFHQPAQEGSAHQLSMQFSL